MEKKQRPQDPIFSNLVKGFRFYFLRIKRYHPYLVESFLFFLVSRSWRTLARALACVCLHLYMHITLYLSTCLSLYIHLSIYVCIYQYITIHIYIHRFLFFFFSCFSLLEDLGTLCEVQRRFPL